MAYPLQIRVKALEYSVEGLTDEQIGEKLDISKYTVGTWKRQLLKTGNLDKKKVIRKSGTPYKYKPDKVKELLEKKYTLESKKVSLSNMDKGTKKPNEFQKPKKKKKRVLDYKP